MNYTMPRPQHTTHTHTHTRARARTSQAIIDYPESNAVLVRRHGVYVWGRTWIEAKTQSECYDYLFESALRMRHLGVDASVPPPPAALTNGGHANTTNGTAGKGDAACLYPRCASVLTA